MTTWRDAILKEFVPGVSKLTLVADPDGLLSEEMLSVSLRERGFDLVTYEDPIEFRFAYESQYRSIWDRGEQTDLVVVLRLTDGDLESLPFDLLQSGRRLTFDLGQLFPNLSYPVIEQLDNSLFDALYGAQQTSSPGRLGDNATRDFILRHVFRVAPELISNDVELLRALLRLHYGNRPMPGVFAEHFVALLEKQTAFSGWPLTEIVPDSEAFFEFLQERWPLYVQSLDADSEIRELAPERELRFKGPEALPFDHQDIKVYIDNLFVEGRLRPIEVASLKVDRNAWVRCGITQNDESDTENRINRLFQLVHELQPGAEANYSDWIAFAMKWAELGAAVHSNIHGTRRKALQETGDALNAKFAKWLERHYASLVNMPPANPAMLHHVPRRIARDIEDSKSKLVALVVVDGLALDQWVTIRQILSESDDTLLTRESATFAWVPTLTSVSRQATFAGKPPMYFPTSINSTNSEEKLWKQFWEQHGVAKQDVAYRRGLGDGDPKEAIDDLIHPGKTRVLGLVVDTVDKIMHGMQLGSAGMHNQIRQWCQTGFLPGLINELIGRDFDIWLTADHGNIECDGKGKPTEGAIAETRGERVRVYPTAELRAQVAETFNFAHAWSSAGLPEDYYPLVASGRDAFVKPGEAIVGHGGIAIEEVIVPLIKIERKNR